MQIINYQYQGREDDWHFSKVRFGKVNLLVGDTGTGKTRFLNTIFSLGMNVASKEEKTKTGYWDVTVKANKKLYRWVLETTRVPSRGVVVTQDNLWAIEDGEEKPIVERTLESFKFLGNDLPKLSQEKTSVFLLEQEEVINPLHEGFGTIMRRHFSLSALENVSTYQGVPGGLLTNKKKDLTLKDIYLSNFHLNVVLFLLRQYHIDVFNKISKTFQQIFPFIEQTNILEMSEIHNNIGVPGNVPVFCIKEKGVDKWIELSQLSSGMQKVLLILADVSLIPEGGIYLIDEYENSLGINAIDFFPSLLNESEKENQFIVTSHHPYLINNIPVKDWFVFHRKGSEVTIKFGDELVERFGKSKQEAFIKLINDPFYKEGIE